jgi:hypothetical protein
MSKEEKYPMLFAAIRQNEHLSEEEKGDLINRINRLDSAMVNDSDSIVEAFSWYKTEEGMGFWSGVACKMYGQNGSDQSE